jgi:hypothetical protein
MRMKRTKLDMDNGTISLSLFDSPYFIWRMYCDPSFLSSVTAAPMVLIG